MRMQTKFGMQGKGLIFVCMQAGLAMHESKCAFIKCDCGCLFVASLYSVAKRIFMHVFVHVAVCVVHKKLEETIRNVAPGIPDG